MTISALKDRVLLIAVCVLVLGFYAWTARSEVRQKARRTADNPAACDPANAYYNLQVDGFRSGQLNLKTEIPPGLAKLADPYDPAANVSYRFDDGLHDTSYYKGKLYLYFGVTPALVLFWPYVALTGHYLFHKQAVAVFCSIGFLASVALLGALRRRYFPEVDGLVVVAGALALGLATCVPIMLQRPDVYEVPISCAYALAMLALAGIWRALHDPARRCRWLAAASLAYGLAVGARPTVLFGAVILLAPVVQAWLASPEPTEGRWLVAARLLAAAVVPISLIGFGLLLYNYLRFGNPFEFGQHYQLSGNKESEMQHLFGLNYLWFNFRIYFLQPIHWGGSFPFVKGVKLPPAPAGQLGVEVPFGLLLNTPLVWMGAAVPLAWQKRTPDDRSALGLFTAVLALFFIISALTLCFFVGACVRYQVDFVPELVLLAMCGILGLERALATKPRWRNLARCAWIATLFFSVTVNLLVGVKCYAEERMNAGLDQLHAGRPKEAIICFEQALRIRPESADVHYDLGNALRDMPGRLPDAIAQYETSLRIDPGSVQTQVNLGTALLNTPGRLSDAIAQFQAALRIDPDLAEAHDDLGNALFNLPGRLPDAIAEYEAALKINPDSVNTHFNLGQALLKIPGRKADAIAQFEEALRLKPDLKPARELLEQLQN
jgi:Tfp pilus assembly protein PilF